MNIWTTITMAAVLSAVTPASSAAANKSLYGRYVFNGNGVKDDAACAHYIAIYDREAAQTITIGPHEIKSNFEGFGPVQFGRTSAGITPFVLQAEGPDATETVKGRAIQKSPTILVLEYADGRKDEFCRL